jgi:hypothetical protein
MPEEDSAEPTRRLQACAQRFLDDPAVVRSANEDLVLPAIAQVAASLCLGGAECVPGGAAGDAVAGETSVGVGAARVLHTTLLSNRARRSTTE